MNEQLINEAMARVEFGDRFVRMDSPVHVLLTPSEHRHIDYTDSHDAVQPVILGLEGLERSKYINEIKYLTCDNSFGYVPTNEELFRIATATALQKCEAVLKAKGLWTKEMEAGR